MAGNGSALECWIVGDRTTVASETLAADTGSRFSFRLATSSCERRIVINDEPVIQTPPFPVHPSPYTHTHTHLNFTANVGLGKWSLLVGGTLEVFFTGDGRNRHPSGRH